MQKSRVETLRKLIEQKPTDPRLRFGIALEYEKLGQWENAATELRHYLDLADDEGNAWGRLGNALRQLGRDEEAQEAYRQGIENAYRHGHPGMAAEFEMTLEEWDD
jgi:Flp pilus assembly protein TadD